MPPLSSTSPSPSSSRQPVAPAARAWAAGQRQRWDRIGPRELCECEVPQRMLTALLQVAHDEGLLGFWRSVCLEYTACPLARLHALSRRMSQPLALEVPDLHAAVLAALETFALPAQHPAA